jgi:regulator of protease activity HflC (stomatin/prohibitin superfamily)
MNMADEPGTEQTTTPTGEGQGKTFTQAELDRIVAERLGRERQKYEGYEDLKAKAQRLEELEAQNQSEAQKAQAKADKEAQRAAQAEARLLRYEVATEKEIPVKLVPLLTATTRDELEAQAALILENAKPALPEFDGGARETAPTPKTPEQAHQDVVLGLFGAKPNN